jgi:hypothetical protein
MDHKLSLTTKVVHLTISLTVSTDQKMIQVLPFPDTMSQETLPGKHLFIFSFLNTAVNSWDYIVSNGRISKIEEYLEQNSCGIIWDTILESDWSDWVKPAQTWIGELQRTRVLLSGM